jgi:hypothetical protein
MPSPLGLAQGRDVASPAFVRRASATLWPMPPAVLPLPSRSGPEGPPQPYGAEPRIGTSAPATGPGWVRAQDRALLYGPFPAGGLARGISDGVLLLSPSAQVRDQTLTRARQAGARVVRIPVDWRGIVEAVPGAGSDLADPGSGVYRFGTLDAVVRGAVEKGLIPLLVIFDAPSFAEAPARWRYAYKGSWDPDPARLQTFAAAVARRYDGSFPDPQRRGATLPRVRLFQAWNEPNLPEYLEPQWIVRARHWVAFSATMYRGMLDAVYAGVKSVAASDIVVSAGIAPNGDPAGVGRTAPVPFLRALLCLPEAHVSCPEPACFDVLAFHPLSVGDPDLAAPSALDVSISDAAKVTALLERAERLHTILPAGRKPVWVTELNWESDPPARGGVPGRLQAAWVSRALHRLWVAGVTLADWQLLVDPYPALALPRPGGGVRMISRPAGLYAPGPGGGLDDARPKPFLRGFALPFDPLRLSRRRVRLWGLAAPGEAIRVQRRTAAGGWLTIARLHTGAHGVLNAPIALAGRITLRLRAGSLTGAPAVVQALPGAGL